MSEERTYYVYMHVNKINNKKYIGITCRTKPEYRWGKDGHSYTGQVFKIAIDKYGWENFDHIILFENLTKEEACKKEQELIKEYQTNQKEFGYNLSSGGEHGSLGYLNNSLSIPVYQYDLDGNFIAEYPSLSEAERITGILSGYIAKCCQGKCKYTKDCQWSYKKVDIMQDVDKFKNLSNRKKNKGKEVYQYTLDGNYIARYETIQEACLKTDTPFTGIYKCCQGRQKYTGKYQWFNEYRGEIVEAVGHNKTNNHKVKAVNVFDINMNFIQSYSSVQEAIDKLSIVSQSKTSIYECLNHNKKTAYGYIWEYV